MFKKEKWKIWSTNQNPQIRHYVANPFFSFSSSISSSFFFFLFSILYRSKISFLAKMAGMSRNGRNKPVQPDIWGSTNHSYFCTDLGFGTKNSSQTGRYSMEFTPLLSLDICLFYFSLVKSSIYIVYTVFSTHAFMVGFSVSVIYRLILQQLLPTLATGR